MGRFDVSLCLVPQITGSGVDYFPEDSYVIALGDVVSHVDDILSHATPRRIASTISASIRASEAFTHETHLLMGTSGNTRATLLELIPNLTSSNESYANSNVPQQCMIFASDVSSVVCEILGSDEMGSVVDVIRSMGQIVLVALKYSHKTTTIVAVDQLSTTVIASLLGSSWCRLWLLIDGAEKPERTVAVVREALAVRDTVESFRPTNGPSPIELEVVPTFFSARAASDVEAKRLLAWWETHLQSTEALGAAAKARQRLAEENAALRTTCTELRLRLAEREEELGEQLDNAQKEVVQLRNEVRTGRVQAAALEERIRQLECEVETHNGVERFEEMQSMVHALQQRCEEVNEEHLRTAAEFQQREMEWQTELRRTLSECEELRRAVTAQGSSMNTVREAVEATRALQEEELDELLGKIRAISAANPSINHRRVSPRTSAVRVLSPAPTTKAN